MVYERCFICNKKSYQTTHYESDVDFRTFPRGSDVDLDGRIHRRGRESGDFLNPFSSVHECPYCGYVSNNLSDKTILSTNFFDSESYRNCNNIIFKSDLAKKCYKSYLIYKESNKLIQSFFYIQYCAWACDDENDDENGIIVRKIGITIINEFLSLKGFNFKTHDEWLLIKFDWMRRMGDFENLINEYENISLEKIAHSEVFRFQLEKAKNRDSSCYSISDVYK
ncbi:hypothetical protein [Methanobrevibacter sp.]|uniref:hypothetical protein n=1 Tax=Methanobrevibacter sp. TaxID=66852 RepID=UPI00388DAC30